MAKTKFQVRYEESAETLGYVYKLHNLDNSAMTLRFVIFFLGMLILTILLKNDFPGWGAPLVKFLVKYGIYWGAIMLTAIIIHKNLWVRVVNYSSEGQGIEKFEERMAERQEPLQVTMRFYHDRFVNHTSIKDKEYGYYRVVRILETEEAFGIVYTQIEEMIGGPKGVFGVPKNCIQGGDVDAFRSFLLEKCTKCKGKVRKFG